MVLVSRHHGLCRHSTICQKRCVQKNGCKTKLASSFPVSPPNTNAQTVCQEFRSSELASHPSTSIVTKDLGCAGDGIGLGWENPGQPIWVKVVPDRLIATPCKASPQPRLQEQTRLGGEATIQGPDMTCRCTLSPGRCGQRRFAARYSFDSAHLQVDPLDRKLWVWYMVRVWSSTSRVPRQRVGGEVSESRKGGGSSPSSVVALDRDQGRLLRDLGR